MREDLKKIELIPEPLISLSAPLAIHLRSFFFLLQDIEHDIENLYCVCAKKKKVIITVVKINVNSELESILGGLARWDVRWDSQRSCGTGLEHLWRGFLANSAVGVLQINSDRKAGHSLEWKRQITRGEERKKRKPVSVCACVCIWARERGFLEVREAKVTSPNGNYRLDLPCNTHTQTNSSSFSLSNQHTSHSIIST